MKPKHKRNIFFQLSIRQKKQITREETLNGKIHFLCRTTHYRNGQEFNVVKETAVILFICFDNTLTMIYNMNDNHERDYFTVKYFSTHSFSI